jgi:hypothetical protein
MINLKSIFGQPNLFYATTDFLKKLNFAFNTPAAMPQTANQLLGEYAKDNDTFNNISIVFFIGIVDDSTFIKSDGSDTDDSNTDGAEPYNYYGIALFAVELMRKPQRSEISEITRAFNRMAKGMPAGIFFRYHHEGNTFFSFAISERFKYKENWRLGEKIGKIIILRDVNIDNPHAGHLRVLESFANHKAKNFNQLHSKLMEVLDLDILCKQFYKGVFGWYNYAKKLVSFPNEENDMNLIRFITRIIFIWFLKEKKLVPNNIFDEEALKKILKNFDPYSKETSIYYNAILQNLFFATLNQKIKDRRFATIKDFSANKRHYGVKNLYRYKNLFSISEKEVIGLFSSVPFLNGGLFDCLDKEYENNKVVYVDGYSRSKANRAFIPDELFFGKNGLFKILNKYKFTLVENTQFEEDIALDPELPGKIFENLLNAYNSETQEADQKFAGSFYVPQEIVNYMVDESLIAHLKQIFDSDNSSDRIEDKNVLPIEIRLRELLAGKDIIFDESEQNKIIKALDKIKILDPVCGSGAFLMAYLHKMVFVLQRLDPDNKQWRKLQEKNLGDEAKGAMKIIDKQERDKRLQSISDIFENNNNDYGRKLYLIEHCIYGVDIQPIAIQISKLRFFISLIIDQKVRNYNEVGAAVQPTIKDYSELKDYKAYHDYKSYGDYKSYNNYKDYNKLIQVHNQVQHNNNTNIEVVRTIYRDEPESQHHSHKNDDNFGLRVLPNLETKFVITNTLVPFQKLNNQSDIFLQEVDKKLEDLKDIMHSYFYADNRIKKEQLRGKETKIYDHISHLLKRNGYDTKEVNKLQSFNRYDQNAQSTWFDPEWMFGLKNGFDIVIGNPPYIELKKLKINFGQPHGHRKDDDTTIINQYETFVAMGNICSLFYERGWQLLKQHGHLCFLTPNKWMRAGYEKNTRQFLVDRANPKLLVDFPGQKLFESIMDVNILLLSKDKYRNKTLACTVSSKEASISLSDIVAENISTFNFGADSWTILAPIEQSIKTKMEAAGIPLKDWGDIKIYSGVTTGCNEAFIISGEKRKELIGEDPKSEDIIKPVLRERDIKPYSYEFADLWLINTHNGTKEKGIIPINIEEYPAIKKYLDNYYSEIEKRQDKGDTPYNLQNCAYIDEFLKQKIVLKIVDKNLAFAILEEGYFLVAPALFITSKHNYYLLGFLQSSVAKHYIYHNNDTQGTNDIGFNIIQSLENIPIPKPTKEMEEEMEILIETKEYEKIERLVYDIYGLNYEEMAYIEKQ